MYKKFALCALLMTPFFAYADNSCPNDRGQYNVNFENTPLRYDYGKDSAQLRTLSPNANKSRANPVGLFNANKGFEVQPQMKIMRNTVNGVTSLCGKITKLNVTVKFHPVIYIATETQGLSCIYNSTHKHEQTHFQIELNALNTVRERLTPFLTTNFDRYFYATTEKEMQEKINLQTKYTLDFIVKTLQDNTIPHHARLDTDENYKRESESCPRSENMTMFQRIRA